MHTDSIVWLDDNYQHILPPWYAAGSDYEATTITVTFESCDSQEICGSVPIINDTIANELNEQFSVTLISAIPEGRFGDNETCITIIDDDIGK